MQDGKLKLDEARGILLLDDFTGLDLTAIVDNWWIGLSMLHTLFTREHNAIAAELKKRNPGWDDERLFRVARLINAALMAKIHTVEWTPGHSGHPDHEERNAHQLVGTTGEHFKQSLGRLSDSEAISGIIDSPPEHQSAPFALTEEFVSVYRMHPLMPDRIPLRRVVGGDPVWINTGDYLGDKTRDICRVGGGIGPSTCCTASA